MMQMEKVVVMGAMTTIAGTVALKVHALLIKNCSVHWNCQSLRDVFFLTSQ